MKTYKKHIVIGLVVLGVVVSGLTANALVRINCNYDSSSGYYIKPMLMVLCLVPFSVPCMVCYHR